MYHDFLGREVEDLEGDNMRREAAQQPRVALLMRPCAEQVAHGDCWNVERPGGEVVSPHVTYVDAYQQIYGVEPPEFDPFCDPDGCASGDVAAEREEAARIIKNRRQMLQVGVCEHRQALSLCPQCSDLA